MLAVPTVQHLFRDGIRGSLVRMWRGRRSEESLLTLVMGHWQLVRLMQSRHTHPLVQRYPKMLHRYLASNFAASFPLSWRRKILFNHYRYLIDRVDELFFERLLENDFELWQHEVDGVAFTITLALTGTHHNDGDLLLTFRHDGHALYQLAFSIVPGFVVGSEIENIMLIGRVQGVRGQLEMIRRASKLCSEASLPQLLVAAAHGLAGSLEIQQLAGVKSAESIYADIWFDYDAFWRSFIHTETPRFFLISVPIPEKPLIDISRAHRRRTRIKRQLKAAIASSAYQRFNLQCLLPVIGPKLLELQADPAMRRNGVYSPDPDAPERHEGSEPYASSRAASRIA
jgi:uncharacterized protein VirK/YbjX